MTRAIDGVERTFVQVDTFLDEGIKAYSPLLEKVVTTMEGIEQKRNEFWRNTLRSAGAPIPSTTEVHDHYDAFRKRAFDPNNPDDQKILEHLDKKLETYNRRE